MNKTLDYRAMGERVRQRRRELGLTQERLAEKADITSSFVGHIERGEKKASAETIVALSECLGVTTDYVLRGRRNRCDQQSCALFAQLEALLKQYGR